MRDNLRDCLGDQYIAARGAIVCVVGALKPRLNIMRNAVDAASFDGDLTRAVGFEVSHMLTTEVVREMRGKR